MQAIGQTVRPSFYISLVVLVIIMTIGFYVLLQPRLRRIALPANAPAPQIPTPKTPQPVAQPAPQPTVVIAPSHDPRPATTPTDGIAQPPRLNINMVTSATQPRAQLAAAKSTQPNPTEQEYTEIRKTFESAGFVPKGTPKIKGIKTAIVAIGTNEVLWIGAIGIKTGEMQRAVQTLSDVFSDTLEDIEININAFVITQTPESENSDILQFKSIDELRGYISTHPNPPIDPEETENFDAFSGYIGTVIDYVEKI